MENEKTTQAELPKVRGLLNQRISLAHFDLIRILPCKKLVPFIENYWVIVWDLTGKPDYLQENLPHPSMHMVIDPKGVSGVFGVHRGVFSYRLSGKGRLFGVKFRPGAFRAFSKLSASSFTDTHLSIDAVFGVDDGELESRFLELEDPAEVGEIVESVLFRFNPVLDEKSKKAGELVDLIAEVPDILRVDQLAKRAQMRVRSVQRLFETHVGVTPKWVIERYRMLAAVDRLNSGERLSLTELSHRLGYFDSAHFTHAFQSLTGRSPSSYYQGDS